MNRLQSAIIILVMTFSCLLAEGQSRYAVVADSISHAPLANASVFDPKGKLIGITRTNGQILIPSTDSYPITVRYLGYIEKHILKFGSDTIFLQENVTELPEVIVAATKKQMLHILAYVREYSTLSSYSDTITMFREKLVDFMLPTDSKSRFRGWNYPRVLSTKSYYRFTDANGLDSVSNRCSHHFTWSDWMNMFPRVKIPSKLSSLDNGVDTLSGKYEPNEIWRKNGERVSVDIDVLADTTSRRWVLNMKPFFNNNKSDFEQFRIRINFDNVTGSELTPLDLASYSFHIESRGRARQMFMFNRYDQPFFVSTYTEVYIADKKYISVKEAKKLDSHEFSANEIETFMPNGTPPLQQSTLELIDRVNNIDETGVRLATVIDSRLKSPYINKPKPGIGKRVLSALKRAIGITSR